MPMADMLIDVASDHVILSLIDGHSGYNQIKIKETDVSKMAFRYPRALGSYEWVVMPFSLKNVGATYQRAMHKIFDSLIRDFMEVYIIDVIIKSKANEQHLELLVKTFERIRLHRLKMNPLKCAFRVSVAHFLGFLVY